MHFHPNDLGAFPFFKLWLVPAIMFSGLHNRNPIRINELAARAEQKKYYQRDRKEFPHVRTKIDAFRHWNERLARL